MMNHAKHKFFARPLYVLCTIMALLIVGVAMSSAPHVAHAQRAACAEVLVMQRGQSLASIAASIFGTQDGVADIIAATNAMAASDASYTVILDPNTVEAGWKLCIPPMGNALPDSEATDSDVTDSDPTVAPTALQRTRSTSSTNRQSRPTPNDGVTSDEVNTEAVNTQEVNTEEANSVPLEQNGALMDAMVAARLGAAGVHPLSIDYLRQQSYGESPLTIESTLSGGRNYRQFLVSYESEGLTLYAAMTVPNGERPATGWPVIIFNHGYIVPSSYSPTERYTEYVDAIASSGYIVLRPDLRGHGNSQGEANGAYGDPGYTIDVLNALAAIKQYDAADANRIGMWGHSMGGYITARAMVAANDIKAGVIWAGVVAPYKDFVGAWGSTTQPSPLAVGEMPVPSVLVDAYGAPAENPGFWSAISANAYVSDISGPVQLHHGTSDADVPVSFSDSYYADLVAAGQMAEYYIYQDDDHNISAGFDDAMRRSLEFLDTHVKLLTPALDQMQTSNSTQPAP